MRWSLLVNGALVALALGTLVTVWSTRDAATTAELAGRKGKLLTRFDRERVSRIELRRGGKALVLARGSDAGAGEFRIERPWPERADVASVSALLGSLELASALRTADGVSQERAGLIIPALEIQLDSGGSSDTLRLGGPAPAPAGARYLELLNDGQQQLYTVSQGLVSELDIPFDKFRETRLLALGQNDLSKLVLESPSGRVELASHEQGFRMTQTDGRAELVDGEALDRVLTALARLTTEQFIEPEAARTALGGGAVRVQLQPKADGKPVSLALGGICPGTPDLAVLLREGGGQPARAGCIPQELSEALRATPAMLALNRPFSARPDEVEELRISAGSARLELARKGNGFLLRLPASAEIPLDAGNLRISDVVRASGQRARSTNLLALGLEPPAGEVTIQIAGAAQSRLESVKVGKLRGDGTRCLERAGDRVVLCLEPIAAHAFDPDATLLKTLQLVRFEPSELLELSLQTPDQQQDLRRSADGGFELEKPRGFQHDGALVTSVVQTLSALRAERWIAARVDPSHGLAVPRLRVSFEMGQPSAPQSHVLLVGAETEAGYFASLSPDPGVFVLGRASVAELSGLLIDRALCPIPAADVSRIALERGEPAASLSLSRRDGGWEGAGLAAERAQQLGEALVSLRADTTVHLGAARPSENFSRPSLTVQFFDRAGKRYRLRIGARSTLEGTAVALCRLDSVDATFTLAAATLDGLQAF